MSNGITFNHVKKIALSSMVTEFASKICVNFFPPVNHIFIFHTQYLCQHGAVENVNLSMTIKVEMQS